MMTATPFNEIVKHVAKDAPTILQFLAYEKVERPEWNDTIELTRNIVEYEIQLPLTYVDSEWVINHLKPRNGERVECVVLDEEYNVHKRFENVAL